MSSNINILDYRRNKAINKVTIMIALFNLYHGVVWFLVGAYNVATVAVITTVLMLLTLFIKRSISNIPLKANLNVCILFVALTISSLMTYQSSELVIFWLFVLPLGTLLFIEKGWFFFWLTLLVITVLVIPFASVNFPITDTFAPKYLPFVKYVQILGLLVSSFIMALLYRNLIFGTINILSNKKAKLSQRSKDLRIAQKYKDQFFANMGHELRTPMNAIMGIADLLDLEDDKNNELISYLRNSSDHLLAVINDLLDFSKMQEKKLELNYEEFDLPAAANSAFNLVKIMAMGKDLKYSVYIDDKLPKHVLGDPRRLNQILINVLTNAVKYTPEKESIYFSCFLDHSAFAPDADYCRVVFEISDTGIGISEKDLQNIFKDYYRGESVRAQNISGTGLGLYITKYLVDAMGGVITIDSKEELGTTVAINIDFRKGASAFSYPKKISDDQETLGFDKPLNILLVDDNNLNLVIAEKQLQRVIPEGSYIHTAINGQEAVEIYKEFDIDIILMDMEMPVMDGVEATSQIRMIDRSRDRYVPIIIITANLGTRDTAPCLDSGADVIIGKPFELHNVSQTMQRLLAKVS